MRAATPASPSTQSAALLDERQIAEARLRDVVPVDEEVCPGLLEQLVEEHRVVDGPASRAGPHGGALLAGADEVCRSLPGRRKGELGPEPAGGVDDRVQQEPDARVGELAGGTQLGARRRALRCRRPPLVERGPQVVGRSRLCQLRPHRGRHAPPAQPGDPRCGRDRRRSAGGGARAAGRRAAPARRGRPRSRSRGPRPVARCRPARGPGSRAAGHPRARPLRARPPAPGSARSPTRAAMHPRQPAPTVRRRRRRPRPRAPGAPAPTRARRCCGSHPPAAARSTTGPHRPTRGDAARTGGPLARTPGPRPARTRPSASEAARTRAERTAAGVSDRSSDAFACVLTIGAGHPSTLGAASTGARRAGAAPGSCR